MCQRRLAFLSLVSLLTMQAAVLAQYPGNYDYDYAPLQSSSYASASAPPFNAFDYVQYAMHADNRATTPSQSIWSGAPIVVANSAQQQQQQQDTTASQQTRFAANDNAGRTYAPTGDQAARQSQRLTPAYLPTSLYNALNTLQFEADEADKGDEVDQRIRTQPAASVARAANHNYDNLFGSDYYELELLDHRRRQAAIESVYNSRAKPQPVLLLPSTMHAHHSSGPTRQRGAAYAYGRTDAGRYYEPALPPRYAERDATQATNAPKYAAHFQEYLRKNPQRLQPIFDTSDVQK